MFDTLIVLGTSPEFLSGFRVGLLSLLLALPAGIWWRRSTGSPAPVAGVLLAVGSLLALSTIRTVPITVWIGVILLALGGWLPNTSTSPRWRVFSTAPLALPGSLILGLVVLSAYPLWIRGLVIVGIGVAAPLVADFDDHYRNRAWGPPLLAISVLGLLFTVPDTEEALVLAGVALPLALLGGPVRLASLGRAGSLMAVGVFLWMAALGGLGRPGAVVGAAASIGLLAAEPLARLIKGGAMWLDGLERPWIGAVVVGIFQLGVVSITSRVAGLQQSQVPAAAIAAVALASATALCAIRQADY